MNRIAFFFSFASLTILAACNTGPTAEELQQKQDSLLQVQQDSLLDLFKGELEAISAKVNEVGASNGLFNVDTTEGKVLSKEAIIKQVESLDGLLSKNQQQLNNLYNRMKASKIKNEELENMMKGMQQRIAEREGKVDELMAMLANKDVQIEQILERVDSMRMTNVELAEEVVKMDEAMHEAFYVIGESKSLKEKGIITKEGGLLGLGGTKKLDVSQLDTSLFKMIDQRETKSFPLYAKKAKLITDHPEHSYEIVLDDEGQPTTLEIKDRKSFWAATNYLVVEVSN